MMEEKRDERRMKKGEILLKARLQMSEESFEGHVIQKKYRQTGEMTKCLCAEQYVCIDIFPRHLGYFLYPFCLGNGERIIQNIRFPFQENKSASAFIMYHFELQDRLGGARWN